MNLILNANSAHDFTLDRLGARMESRGRSWGVIKICPKCGRKGAYRVVEFKKGRAFDEYQHYIRFVDNEIIPHWTSESSDYCWINVVQAVPA